MQHANMMKPIKWQADEVAAQISQMLLAFPELDEDEVLRADMFEGQTNLHDTLRNMERIRHEAADTQAAIKLYMDEMHARAGRFERREQAMRAIMFKLLQLANLQKVELPEATLSIRAGQYKTIITDEHLLTDEFVRIKREPDKGKIKAALMTGTAVPGALLSNPEPTLAIRTK